VGSDQSDRFSHFKILIGVAGRDFGRCVNTDGKGLSSFLQLALANYGFEPEPPEDSLVVDPSAAGADTESGFVSPEEFTLSVQPTGKRQPSESKTAGTSNNDSRNISTLPNIMSP